MGASKDAMIENHIKDTMILKCPECGLVTNGHDMGSMCPECDDETLLLEYTGPRCPECNGIAWDDNLDEDHDGMICHSCWTDKMEQK